MGGAPQSPGRGPGVLPAEDPGQCVRTDVQSRPDVGVVEVEGGGGGVGAGWVQPDILEERRCTTQLLETSPSSTQTITQYLAITPCLTLINNPVP